MMTSRPHCEHFSFISMLGFPGFASNIFLSVLIILFFRHKGTKALRKMTKQKPSCLCVLVANIRFFSNLVGEEGPRIPGVKDPRVYFLKTLSAPLTFFRFLQCLFVMYPIHLFQLNLNPPLIISAFPIRKQNHKICKASFSIFIRLFCGGSLEPLNPRILDPWNPLESYSLNWK